MLSLLSLPITKPTASTPQYRYTKLNGVIDIHPVTSTPYILVNVFGVIVEFDEGQRELVIKDETCEAFRVKVTINKQQGKPAEADDAMQDFLRSFRQGVIIRIHRLTLYRNDRFNQHIPKLHNLVVGDECACLGIPFLFLNTPLHPHQLFDPFVKKPAAKYLAKEATFEAFDQQRVKELVAWDCGQLLTPRAQPLPNSLLQHRTDGAFVVLAVERMANDREGRDRTVIVCLNGRPVPGYPCSRLLNKQLLTERWRELKASHEGAFARFLSNYLGAADFGRLYDSGSLTFLNAFGEHATVDLRPLDVVVVHGILIKRDNLFGDYSYLVYKGGSYGRALKKADAESPLGKRLHGQIWRYSYMMQQNATAFDLALTSAERYEQLAAEVEEQLGLNSSNNNDIGYDSDSAETDIEEEEFVGRGDRKLMVSELEGEEEDGGGGVSS